MGLDMYMTGRKFFWSSYGQESLDRKEDGHRVSRVEVDLGYWRKHPDLHGYIVQTFRGGVDDCQDIKLSGDKLRDIIDAVQNKRLPKTSGFFFGESENDAAQIAEDVKVLQAAIDWLEASDVKPVELGEFEPLGGPFKIAEVKIDKTGAAIDALNPDTKPKQRVSREVIYCASW